MARLVILNSNLKSVSKYPYSSQKNMKTKHFMYQAEHWWDLILMPRLLTINRKLLNIINHNFTMKNCPQIFTFQMLFFFNDTI